jgi:molecular chaperone DnaK (HSP70)
MAGVGLYLGSTSACVALYKSGKVELLTDDTGSRTTPTCVALIGGDLLVGLLAKQRLVQNPESCICDIKKAIGKQ